MKSLNNIIENFFSNVGAKPMTLREFICKLLDFETSSEYEKYINVITDDRLVDDLLDWMLEDDFDESRKIKGVSIRKFLLNNIDKPILINTYIVDGIAPRMSNMPKPQHLRGRYKYNLTVDGEEFVWFRYDLYPWIPNKPKKI